MSTAVLSLCAPITDVESRAAIRAVGRILDLAGEPDATVTPIAMADALQAARTLPDFLAQPDDFRDRFRSTLERLARRHRRFSPVLDEFDEATDRHAYLWIDCGEAD